MPARLSRAASALLVASLAFAAAHAATYHVSPSGNDAADGLGPATAWRTLAKVNSTSFQAGDQILLEGGATFTDQGIYLGPDDAGSAANPIVVGSYGAGRARVKPSSDSHHPVLVYNTAGIVVENLILEGVGRDASTRTGVLLYTDLPGGARLAGVTVRHCEITGLRTGVELGAWPADSSFGGFDQVLLEHLLVHTIRRDGINTYGLYPGSSTRQSHRDLVIRDCEVRDVTGDPAKTDGHSGSGIIVSGVKGALVDRCHAHHNGGSGGNTSGGGPVGIWTWGSDSVTIQRSLVHDQRTKAGVKDGGGFDIDGGATNALVQYCYSYDNEGPGFLVAEFDNAPPLGSATFRYNISWRDGRRTANAMASGFHFWKGSGSASTLSDVHVHHNLVYTENSTGGPALVWQAGAMSGIRVRNNLFVVSGGERFVDVNNNAARGYFTFQNNAYWAVDDNWAGGWRWGGGTTFTTLAAWRAATGAPETLSGAPLGLDADPRVADLVAGARPTSVSQLANLAAFRLLADSPLLDAALDLRLAAHGSLDLGARDFFGLPIPSGGAFDIGPHERTAALVAFRTAHALPSDGSADTATPAGDGVPNLLKYAFNLLGAGPAQVASLATPHAPVLAPEGVSGLPRLDLVAEPPGLALTYVRRRAVTRPGIIYEPQFSDTLAPGSWAPDSTATETIVPLDEVFERVTVRAAPAAPRRFARLRVAPALP
jgi:hypothetical protein